jgi:hypothetical protein
VKTELDGLWSFSFAVIQPTEFTAEANFIYVPYIFWLPLVLASPFPSLNLENVGKI